MPTRKSIVLVFLVTGILVVGMGILFFGEREHSEKEHRLAKARIEYKFTASLHRWTGRLFDLQEKHLGPLSWANRLSNKVDAINAGAWEDFQEASHSASIERVATFTDRRDAEAAHAKLRLSNFGRNFSMRIIGLYSRAIETRFELQVPNQYAAEAASILEEAQLSVIAIHKDGDRDDLSRILALLTERGILASAISTSARVDNSPEREIVVLKKNREKAVRILKTVLLEEIDTTFPVELVEVLGK